MSLELIDKPKETQKFIRRPDPPMKLPSKNNFPEPEELCSISICPNTSLICGLCWMHCRKIHKMNHSNLTHDDLKKMIDEYEAKNK